VATCVLLTVLLTDHQPKNIKTSLQQEKGIFLKIFCFLLFLLFEVRTKLNISKVHAHCVAEPWGVVCYLTRPVNCGVSRDSVVGIATGYWLDDRGVGVQVPMGSRIFTSPCRPDRLSEVHQTLYPMGSGGSFLGGKAAGA
jgi:hypothetical protein